MKIISVVLLALLSACGSLISSSPQEGKTVYSYTDVTGQYQYHREKKQIDKKFVTRSVLISSGNGSKIVEKSVAVGRLGSVKAKGGRLQAMRPEASEFVVWLEGKKYQTRMKINEKTKSMNVTMDSPEEKWKGTQEVPFPKGNHFCFFSQIPECLYHTQLLQRTLENPQQDVSFYIVWDSYPYTQEQFSEVGKELFAGAILKYETEDRGLQRYLVEVNGQLILYHFSKSFDLVKMSWIAQGITVVPIGEQESSLDE